MKRIMPRSRIGRKHKGKIIAPGLWNPAASRSRASLRERP
jgi:hypothetical protein